MKKTSVISVFGRGMKSIISGSYQNLQNRVGEVIQLNKTGNSYRIFKQSAILNMPENTGAYFFVEFKFKPWVLNFFSPTIPFFVGMPGFKSKLWLVDDNTGVFAGRYVFASKNDAEAYGHSFAQKLVKKLCIPGQHHWWVE